MLLSGCGRKTPPLPPQRVVPQAIDDLRFILGEKGVELRWSYPQRTEQGERLTGIEEFDIFRAVVAPEDYCPQCPLPFGPPRTIAGGTIPLGISGRTATFRDTALSPEHLYFYKVRSRGGWYYSSPDSNIVSFLWKTPLAPPQNLTVSAGDNEVHLSWQPAVKLIDGSTFEGPLSYQVYRSNEEGAAFTPVGPVLHETTFTDLSVINDRRYFYTVRALQQAGESLAPGQATPAVSALPQDLTPPSPPTGLIVRRQDSAAILSWQPPAAKDLAGFIIYRRCVPLAREIRGTTGHDANQFVDQSPPSLNCLYQVSAFDGSSNESPPTPETGIAEQ